MDPFVLKSVAGSGWLEFSGPVCRGATEYDDSTFTASLRGDRVTAAVRVVDLGSLSRWTEFFESMAREWRGWPEPMDLTSSEGHLGLSCSADYLGHVHTRVQLRGDFSASDWIAAETLVLEAGQLEEIARKARLFFG